MSVLVCVTGQRSCERLIVTGASIAAREGQPLSVLHVVRTGGNVLGFVNEPQALEYLLRTSIDHGADMTVRRADDVVNAIEAEARRLDARVIVAGRAANYGGWDLLDELKLRLPEVRFEILGA
ncbi:MAG: universal stress protein UspA [Clostridia bacterium]|nr:universal stress protein UspA [Clostridia bacterium]